MSKFIRVDEWKPSKADIKVDYDGKLMVIQFDKLFSRTEGDALNTFIIKKESYVKRLPDLCQYINYFIKYYDHDNELLLAYLKLKYLLDNKQNKISLETCIKLIYSILLTESMTNKIKKMTEDNYYIDLTNNTGIKYNETLEFTADHAKVLMNISISMKIMVPIMFHYLNIYNYIKDRSYIFRFYEGLFDLYGKEIDIYNKLFISIHSKVNVNYVRNKVIWNQREFFGVDPLIQMVELLKDKIISETIFKFQFDKNVVS